METPVRLLPLPRVLELSSFSKAWLYVRMESMTLLRSGVSWSTDSTVN